jgi:uncharacterized repeat protein (TIGR03803 family)
MPQASARALRVIAVVVWSAFAAAAHAGSFEVLHRFEGGADGAVPEGGVTQGADGAIYGTAAGAGTGGHGTLFRLSDAQFEVLHQFTGGADGSSPEGTLLLARDGHLVGTTYYGGSGEAGTVFRYRADVGYEQLAVFESGAGSPASGLVEGDDGALYGTTTYSSVGCDCGTLFRLDPRTAQRTTLHAFNDKDGAYPRATPAFAGGRLVGTTGYGGIERRNYNGPGVHYVVSTDGSGFASRKPADGSELFAGLTADRDGRLWGVAHNGGPGGGGGVYRVDGSGMTEWAHTFKRGRNAGGSFPSSTLLLGADGMLYGTTEFGGLAPVYRGTVFRIDPTTGSFTVLHAFDGLDGNAPTGALVQDAQGRIVGVTSGGGELGLGVVYRLTP